MRHSEARHVPLVIALLLVSASAAADTSYVFYTVESVRWGTGDHQLCLPRTYPSSPELTPAAIVSEAFQRLKSFRGSLYNDANVNVGGDFGSSGSVEATLGAAAQAELAVVLSEVYWTLKAAGAREIRLPELKKEPLSDSDVPFGVAGFVAQLWQVLPPATPGNGLVRVGATLESATTVRQKFETGDKNIVAAVVALLKSPAPFVRQKAVPVVAKLATATAEPALIPLLKDPDMGVKKAALATFEGSKSKKVHDALEHMVQTDPDPTVKSLAVKLLNAAGITKYQVFVLFEKLKDPDEGVVRDAIEKLGKGGKPEAALALIEVLGHKNTQIQDMAMKAIVALGSTPALVKIVDDDKIAPKFRADAAKVLAKGSADEADKGLAYLAKSGSTAEQISAIEDVAKRRRYKVVADVIGALGSADPTVRAAAAKALGEIKDSKSLQPLADAMKKNPSDVTLMEAAVIAIFGGLSLDEVIKTSDSPDPALTQLAVKSLAKFAEGDRPNPRVIEVLKKKLGDADKDLRRSAAFALARINDPGVVQSLVALKADSDATIREQVATAVAKSKLPDADAILQTYLDDTDLGTRRAAVDGLRERKVKAALAKLRFLYKHPDEKMRRSVCLALVELGGVEAWDAHFQMYSELLFDQSPEVKMCAARGIGGRRDARVPGLLQSLVSDSNTEVQKTALEVLGKTGDPAAVEAIAMALTDAKKDIKIAALEALGSLKIEAAKKPIMEFVKNESDKDLVKRANAVFDTLP